MGIVVVLQICVKTQCVDLSPEWIFGSLNTQYIQTQNTISRGDDKGENVCGFVSYYLNNRV